MVRYEDIPKFTRSAGYRINVGWLYLEKWIDDQHDDLGNLFQMDPDFQRAHVWSETQQQRYVEYILREGHGSRDIQWNCSTWHSGGKSPLVLVDGKQRLEAVRKFMRNELIVFDKWKLSDFDRIRDTKADFVFNVNDLQTRAEVLQWYLDLNAGGVVHTDEEINRVRKLLELEK